MYSASPEILPRAGTDRRRHWRALAALPIGLAVIACAAPQTDRLRESPGNIAPRAEAAVTEFLPQREDEAGAASLAMALRHSRVDVTPDDLAKEVRVRDRDGSLPLGLVATAHRHGRLAYPVRDMRSILREINAGRPVIVLLNLGLPWIPQMHYAVVIGYDLGPGTVTLHSGQTPRKIMPMEVFERTWERAGYWAILVLEPGTMPTPPVHRRDYLQAIQGLEYAGRYEAARMAYAVALRHWPDDLTARMGLGNALHALGNRKEAAETFAAAVRIHPAAAEAHFSLARVLIELGDLNRARLAAKTAIALDGPNVDAYRQTLKAIIGLEPHSDNSARAGGDKKI